MASKLPTDIPTFSTAADNDGKRVDGDSKSAKKGNLPAKTADSSRPYAGSLAEIGTHSIPNSGITVTTV